MDENKDFSYDLSDSQLLLPLHELLIDIPEEETDLSNLHIDNSFPDLDTRSLKTKITEEK